MLDYLIDNFEFLTFSFRKIIGRSKKITIKKRQIYMREQINLFINRGN
jgi:hypothetical protein